ncbi:glutaminase A [Gordonia zhaorongruii]|uniref:glutaminase A n=1 Tax=Gordonia zhaorongruii TaxID=2597659 RepID=UPI001181231F|nr:glutaminase A [Gordonia zhaorongruii]
MIQTDLSDVPQRVSTGDLPSLSRVGQLITDAHERYASNDDGIVADYIPALAEADPSWFGISLVGVNGSRHAVGDVDVAFSVQSISKAFMFALMCERYGREELVARIGVNNTGLPFDSVMAVELNDGRPLNPMVNAGAIGTTALVPGENIDERWTIVREGLSAFAGRPLEMSEEVYESETRTNDRNRAIARLVYSYGRMAVDPAEAVEVYTRQCSLMVTADDLAVMGATLADGGVNPITGQRVVSNEASSDTLAVMASCGMYERSGEWLFEIGTPAKSGVSGGIVSIAPGKGATGLFSPRLDFAGNSVRGQHAAAYISCALGFNMFASSPHAREKSSLAH